MKYVDEFRNKKLVQKIASRIKEISPSAKLNIMEVCGTHTQNFYRFGLGKLIPQNIRFISGPGCPVCVSSQKYIDTVIKLARKKDALILTFGDMLRIPGSKSTLEKERAKSGNVRVVYSAFDALKVARQTRDKKIVFLAVGFETTAPTIALTIISAKKEKLKNLFFLCSLKLIPPAMDYLAQDKRLTLSGFLCPGHVSAIIGARPYEFIARRYRIACCVAGFEPLDILEGIYLLLRQVIEKKSLVANQYARVVTRSGNRQALKLMRQVFRVSDAEWRGLGNIPRSGLKIRDAFGEFDAAKEFDIKPNTQYPIPNTRCKCGDVLKGLIMPLECPLFAKTCLPDHPVGPCMVSSEGACSAYYKYR